MHVLVIYASPREHGVTAKLAAAFIEGLPTGASVTQLFLPDKPVLPCLACNACADGNGCRQHDIDDIYAQLEDADVLCLAVPVYNLAPPSTFKALLDRLQCYYEAPRQSVAQKKPLVLLSASGQRGNARAKLLEKQILPNFALLGYTLAGHVHAAGTDGHPTLEKEKKKTAVIAKRLLK